MGWEDWLSRNPHLRLVRYYNAQFFVVGLLALASAVVGVIGLLGQLRWGLGALFGAGAVGLLLAASLLYRNNYLRLMQLGAPAPTGVVAFSFGNRRPGSGPSPINLQLAEIAHSMLSSWYSTAAVAAQSEIADHLDLRHDEKSFLITQPTDGSYLDSAEVWRQAEEFFRQTGITRIIAVAHPFLHLQYVRHLVRRDGFQVVPVHIPRLGFDRSEVNLQWWTRGRLRLIGYSISLPIMRRFSRRARL